MKMSQQRYEQLRDGIVRVVESCGGAEKVQAAYQDKTHTRMMWDLLYRVTDDFMNDDTHPLFRICKRSRINPYQGRQWNLYHDNGQELHDNHVDTALKKIGKELGLIQARRVS